MKLRKEQIIRNLKRIKDIGNRKDTHCHQDHIDMSKALDKLIERLEK